MEANRRAILWITDPWETLAHSQDTTLRLMSEATKMGIPTFWSASDFIFNTQSPELLRVETYPRTQDIQEILPSNFQQIHFRVDPPVNAQYLNLLHELQRRITLELHSKTEIVNPPELLEHQSEKVPPPELLPFTAKHLVIQSQADLLLAHKTFNPSSFPEIVTKPMNLAQSIGVKKYTTPHFLSEWETLIRKETEDFTKAVVVEEYLSGIQQGETRIWFVNGEVVASLKKYPVPGDFRVLIDQGSRIEAHTLTQAEEKIALQIGFALKKQRARLAAVDLIDEKICDYNITSPGLLMELERVHPGKNFARTLLEGLTNAF